MSNWELEHQWSIVRYLVYYLLENLVPAELIQGKDVIDFSSGLGDLSVYMAGQKPKSILASAPDDSKTPPLLRDHKSIRFLNEISAKEIQSRIPAESVDLFTARMVFQFPTQEEDQIDVDGMLAQVYQVLRPGGRLIIASHEYSELDRQVQAFWEEPTKDYFARLKDSYSAPYRDSLKGLIELIETIGIPPREGIHGQTGFGLKALMTVDSFVRAGFHIERSEEIEDFTFPIGLSKEIEERADYYEDLSKKVFAIKREHIQSSTYQEKYKRPQALRKIFSAISELHHFVSIPIFTIQARK